MGSLTCDLDDKTGLRSEGRAFQAEIILSAKALVWEMDLACLNKERFKGIMEGEEVRVGGRDQISPISWQAASG